jgi:hypothetical protein
MRKRQWLYWRLGRPRKATDKVPKKRQHDGGEMKVLKPQELMKGVLNEIEGVNINLSETEAAVERWVGLLELAASALAETMNWTSQVESDVVGLRAAMADGSAKVEEI